jgi:BirA family biotin operon repressor/biotin-[acetyl-CoA-carboxylase] ligase
MMDSMQFESLPLFSKPHFSWNLNTDYIGRRFVYRPDSDSTMDDARRMLERFRLTNGALLLAESQTAGRGRAGRSWVSPPDVNLYFTIILTPAPEDVRCLPYVTPLAVALAVEEVAAARGSQLGPDLKWPNDVLLDGKKIAGVLIETTSLSDGRLVALVGVGINVNLDVAAYPEIVEIATSLKEALGFPVSREELLAAVCNHLESLYESARHGSNAPFSEWRSRLVNLGRYVVANGAHERVEGIAVDVGADGALIIEQASGVRIAVEAGDVTLSHGAPD